MSKIDKLTEIAGKLSEDQIEGLIHYAQTLVEEPFLDRAPPEALESLERGLADARAGRVIDAKIVFERLEKKIKDSR
ncbi:MAG: hypothetical protein EKK41_19495 [Hyphomicrobiales bacterium]|nr:MAG: hypothetical protein EKK41_19495 [Hyphomicrobiales bacterium]